MNLYNKINSGEPYIIAEMSANHCGDPAVAFRIIEEAAKAGADCLKIQTYTADTLTVNCSDEPYMIKGGLWDGLLPAVSGGHDPLGVAERSETEM